MAKREHKLLADRIKCVHSDLRKSAQKHGFEIAWKNHCDDAEKLDVYSQDMQKLATSFWETNAADPEKEAQSRILWIAQYIQSYFQDYIHSHREKERRIADKLALNCDEVEYFKEKYNILDVGSCYNPFSVYDFLNVTPLDIAPANPDVYKCDFLNIPITNHFSTNENKVLSLPKCYYDAVIFCFLLEYIPSSAKRKECCAKAYELLKNEGIIVIATPDSKHVGANSRIMKTWRYTLGLMGFSRIKYEKYPFMHCMSFRKALHPGITVRWSKLHFEPFMSDDMPIPQDNIAYTDRDDYNIIAEKCDADCDLFHELPFSEI